MIESVYVCVCVSYVKETERDTKKKRTNGILSKFPVDGTQITSLDSYDLTKVIRSMCIFL